MDKLHRTHDNNHSSLFDKLPENLRRRLDLAIFHRIPPTFKELWMHFELANFGVSFSALYRYARRLRDRLNIAETVLLADDADADVDAAIQKLYSRRLLELLLHTHGDASMKEVAILASARRKGEMTAHDARRLDVEREHLRLKSEALQLSRRALEGRPAQTRMLRLAGSDDDPAARDSAAKFESQVAAPAAISQGG